MTKPYLDDARAVATSSLRLASLLESTEEIQWRPALNPKPRFDTTERAPGGISDPTSTTALDERRLALREQVDAASRALRTAATDLVDELEARHAALNAAIDAWNG